MSTESDIQASSQLWPKGKTECVVARRLNSPLVYMHMVLRIATDWLIFISEKVATIQD